MTVVATVPMVRPEGSAPRIAPRNRLRDAPEQHRAAERGEASEAVEQRQVVRHRLAEADARVEHDLLLAHAARQREGHALLEEREHLVDHVVVARVVLHALGHALHVHQADGAARLGDHGRHLVVVPQRAHVVEERRPGGEGAARDLGLHRVDGDGHAHAAGQRLDHRQHAAQLLVQRDRARSPAAWTRRRCRRWRRPHARA